MVTLSLRGSGDRAIVAECERMYGLHVSRLEFVSEIDILVFSTSNFKITNLVRRMKMKDNSFDGNIGHSDNEIEMDGLDGLEDMKVGREGSLRLA